MRLFRSLSFWLSALCLLSLLAGWLLPMWGVMPADAAVYLFMISYLSGGYYGVKEGVVDLKQGKASVDLLMILAALGAASIDQWMEGAILLFLFSLSNALQEFALEKSNRAIEALMKLRPDTACVRDDEGNERQVPIEDIVVGQTVIVRPGERFPLDAVVIDGTTTVDQSAITGESIPVDKVPGNDIFAGTMNNMGAVAIRVTKPATESTLARIVEMVQRARKGKARTQRILDEFEPKYALSVILITILLIVVPYTFGWGSFDEIFYRAMTILVVASPCALVISTPATILSAIAHAARKGVLFKGGGYLEQAASIQYVAMDKTGTLTKGMPEVVGVYPLDSITPTELLQQAANAERLSEHPLAAAVVRAAHAQGMRLDPIVNLRAVTGKGVEVELETHVIRVGSRRLMDDAGIVRPEAVMQRVDELEMEGKTVVFVARDLELLGLIALADVIKPEARQAIADLRRLGVKQVVMLTGDSHRVAESVALQLGIADYRAELLPGSKERIIQELAAQGPVAMVGDGVNDAPALASGNLGVAMGGAGTDVALETADVVLMSDDLTRLPWLIQLSRRARAVVWQNIIFSMTVIGVLVTAVFVADLPLPLGVIGHEGSTLIVVANGLRLLGGSRISA